MFCGVEILWRRGHRRPDVASVLGEDVLSSCASWVARALPET